MSKFVFAIVLGLYCVSADLCNQSRSTSAISVDLPTSRAFSRFLDFSVSALAQATAVSAPADMMVDKHPVREVGSALHVPALSAHEVCTRRPGVECAPGEGNHASTCSSDSPEALGGVRAPRTPLRGLWGPDSIDRSTPVETYRGCGWHESEPRIPHRGSSPANAEPTPGYRGGGSIGGEGPDKPHTSSGRAKDHTPCGQAETVEYHAPLQPLELGGCGISGVATAHPPPVTDGLEQCAHGPDTTRMSGAHGMGIASRRGENPCSGTPPTVTGAGQGEVVAEEVRSGHTACSGPGGPTADAEQQQQPLVTTVTLVVPVVTLVVLGVVAAVDLVPVVTLAVLGVVAVVAAVLKSMRGVVRSFPGYLFLGAVFALVAKVGAVCPHCSSNIPSCTFDSDGKCPAVGTITENAALVAGVAAASVTALKLTSVISTRFLRMFTRAHLNLVLELVRRPAPGSVFEMTPDTKLSAILHAVGAGQITLNQACVTMMGFVDDEADETKQQKLMAKYKLLTDSEKVTTVGAAGLADTGVFTWLYGKITHFVAERGMQVKIDVDVGSSSSSAANVLTTTIKRTKSMVDFFESLNLFIMFTVALGMCGTSTVTEFLEFVVFDTIRMRGEPWQLAHELFVLMLRRIEDSGGKITFGNSMNEGHLGTLLEEARVSTAHYYGDAVFFRGAAQGRRGRNGNDNVDDDSVVCKPYNGKCTPTSSTPCWHWNTNQPHPKDALRPDGTCKRAHVCDQYVSNKGVGGKCMGPHSRDKCDNPHKCSAKERPQ